MTPAIATAGIPLGDALPLTTDGVLVALRVRAAVRPEALLDDILAILARARAVVERGSMASTLRDLRQIQADLAGSLGEILDFRDEFDAWRAVEALPVVDGADLVRLWRWERALRRQLIGLQGRIVALQDTAAELAEGLADRVVLVRAGDTWQRLAQQHLGDWRSWRKLVEHNAGDPTGPTPGDLVAIPRT